MRTTTNISITIPPKLLQEAIKVAKREGRTQSELVREALRHYIKNQEWQELKAYGKAQAKALGIKPSDVSRLVKEVRKDKRTK